MDLTKKEKMVLLSCILNFTKQMGIPHTAMIPGYDKKLLENNFDESFKEDANFVDHVFSLAQTLYDDVTGADEN